MSKVLIVKTANTMPAEPILAHIRRFLFGLFDGWTEADKKGWRKIWKRLNALQPGEFAQIEFVVPRSSPYHRRHMALENAVFDSQEQFEDRDALRAWLKIGACWVDWCPGSDGNLAPVPRSISFAAADQSEFEQYHAKVVAFLRGPYAAPYLWPHLGDQAGEMMDHILSEFDE